MTIPGFEQFAVLPEAITDRRSEFLQILNFHMIDRPVRGKDIGDRLGLTDIQIRALRRYCWAQGDMIGSCSKGYYLARNADELNPTLEHIEARAKAAVWNVKAVKHLMGVASNGQEDLF